MEFDDQDRIGACLDKREPATLPRGLKREKLPNHVAIIMDGNGRWAQQRSRPRVFGHRHGMKSVKTAVRAADDLGIKVLSLFAFSEENWGRPNHEVSVIFTLLNTYLLKERRELHERGVQLRIVGHPDRLPEKSRRLIEETQEMMEGNTGLVLNVAVSYGGRTEIVDVCRELASRAARGEISPDDIDRELFESSLATWGLPDPDLLIRTSGEQRISNFMLWQLAYTEMHFPETLWPDFSRDDFVNALVDYQNRQRRYGLLPGSGQKTKERSSSLC